MKPIIITGSGRSGTSYLTGAIGAHPQVCGEHSESWLFNGAYGLIRLTEILSTLYSALMPSDLLDRFIAYLRGAVARRLTKVIPRPEVLVAMQQVQVQVDGLRMSRMTRPQAGAWASRTVDLLTPLSEDRAYQWAADFVEKVIEEPIRAATGLHTYTENTPWNSLLLPQIARVLPTCRIVHIHRDPRDVVASIANRPWTMDKTTGIEHAMNIYDIWLTRWEAVASTSRALPHYMEVKGETLTQQGVWPRILEFVGLPLQKMVVANPSFIGRHHAWSPAVRQAFDRRFQARAERQGFL
jgi:hypothetical protein